MSGPEELTPVKNQTNWELVFEQLGKTEQAARSAANESIATRAEVNGFKAELASFRGRLSALEAERIWIPMILSALAFALSLFSILRRT